MIQFSDGYIPMLCEWERHHNFKPSFFQRFVWFFYPTKTYVQWKRYKSIRREDCYSLILDGDLRSLKREPGMRVNGERFIFSTGKEVYANNGIIGLCEPGKWGWDVTEGYDGGIDMDDFTKEEKIELADYMLSLWQRFKDEAGDPNNWV